MPAFRPLHTRYPKHRLNTVHLVLDGEVGDGRAGEVVIDDLIYLSGRQKGLNSCNRPHDRPPKVANRGLGDPMRGAIDTPFPPLDQGIKPRGKVCEEITQGPQGKRSD